MMQCHIGFAQSDTHVLIPLSWVLLDTCSTSSVSNNTDNVSSIRDCSPNDCLKMFTNGSTTYYDQIATLKLLPLDVHFNEDSMATILSVKDVANLENVHITMDTRKERAIFVHHDDEVLKFEECADGLYYYDTAALKPLNVEVTNYSFLETVADNSIFLVLMKLKER